jgi:hypothetical protein
MHTTSLGLCIKKDMELKNNQRQLSFIIQ